MAHELLAALPDTEKAFWAVALFCGLRRGELRGLQWTNVDFDNGVIRVERSWDPVKGPVDVKTGAGRRWAGHGDVRQTWNRYGHLVPGGEDTARERLDAFLTPANTGPTVAQTVAHDPKNDETPENTGVLRYRYRDSKTGFRGERRLDGPLSSSKVIHSARETG